MKKNMRINVLVLLFILILCLSACGTKTASSNVSNNDFVKKIRKHDSKEDIIKILDTEWLSDVDSVLIVMNKEICDKNFDLMASDNQKHIIRDLKDNRYQMGHMSIGDRTKVIANLGGKDVCRCAINYVIEKTEGIKRLYSIVYHFIIEEEKEYKEMQLKLAKKYGEPHREEKTGDDDLQTEWIDKNGNTITLTYSSPNEYSSSIMMLLAYSCGDAEEFIHTAMNNSIIDDDGNYNGL